MGLKLLTFKGVNRVRLVVEMIIALGSWSKGYLKN